MLVVAWFDNSFALKDSLFWLQQSSDAVSPFLPESELELHSLCKDTEFESLELQYWTILVEQLEPVPRVKLAS